MTLLLILLILPVVTGLLSMFVPSRRLLENLNLGSAVLTLLGGLTLAAGVFAQGPLVAGPFYVDALGAFEVAISVVVGMAAVTYARGYMGLEFVEGRFPYRKLQRFYGLTNAFWSVFLLTCVANNLGVVWISIEGTTLATAFLVAFYNKQSSIEAAWKYFVLCTVGISLALMGLILLYYSATRLPGVAVASLDWSVLAQQASHLDPDVLKLSFVFTLVGYGTKVGLAPMHTWLPDAHSEAPSPVSAMLSGMLLNGAMYGVIRSHALVVRCVGEGLSNRLLVMFGLLSLAIAVPFILRQRDFKRLLAYSSVEHMGIIALGLGIGGPLGTFGALLHTLYHSLIKSMLFFSAGNLILRYRTREIAGLRGVFRTLPTTGPVLLLGTFAIAGAPPFGLFLSELTILTAGFRSGQVVASSLMLAAIVLVFAGFANHVSRMAFGKRPGDVVAGELSRWTVAPLLGLLALSMLLGTYLPAPLHGAIQQIVTIIQGGP